MKGGIFFICFAFLIGSISSLKPKIVGGTNAEVKGFPFIASLRLRGSHFCGGCIIGKKHILTAAHCITRRPQFIAPYNDYSVTTGTSFNIADSGVSHKISSFVVHPEWVDDVETSLAYDIAVITLTTDIKYNLRQQKIELTKKDVVSQAIGTLIGWGKTATENRQCSLELQQLDMKILNSTDCQAYHVTEIHEKSICAFHSPGRGSCYGDSGGPLVIGNQVVGILSWISGKRCATGTAEAFTNVYAVRDFIIPLIN